MISQKESNKVRMGTWFLKLLSKDMKRKTKNKDQPTHNHVMLTQLMDILLLGFRLVSEYICNNPQADG